MSLKTEDQILSKGGDGEDKYEKREDRFFERK